MPVAVESYKCPLCDSLFITLERAVECAAECSQFERRNAWACGYCGHLFDSKSDALDHEKACTAPFRKPEPGEETCAACNNADKEGHRYRPCPDLHFAPIRTACDYYTPATK